VRTSTLALRRPPSNKGQSSAAPAVKARLPHSSKLPSAVLTSAGAAFFYVRVIVLMYFSEPVGAGPSVTTPSVLTAVAIAMGVATTLVLGIVPGPVLDLAANAGQFIR